jgi:hypothetical protein
VTDLAEMWAHLEAHQSFADERGYGLEWKRMCEQRTEEAAYAAEEAAYAAEEAAAKAADAADAAWLARAAAEAAEAVAAAAARVDQYSELAIDAMRGIKP